MALAEPQARRSLDTIWYTRCPVPTAFSIAIHLGWLEEEFAGDGIRVSSLRHVPDAAVRESHFDHTLDDSFRYGGNIPPIWARSRGADTKLIGLAWIDAPHVILTLPESGIRMVKDLKGRRLSVPRRINDQIDFWRAGAIRTYEVALASEGLTLDDVELVEIPIRQTYIDGPDAGSESTGSLFSSTRRRVPLSGDVFALIQGKVDALFSESSFATHLIKFLGAVIVHDVHNHPDALIRHNNAIPQAFTVSGALTRDRPDLVARVLARTLAAGEWAKTHRDEVIRITAHEAGVSEEIAHRTYPLLEHQLDTAFSPASVKAVQLRKQFLLSHGFIDRDFDLETWIDRAPLAQATRIVRDR